MGANRRNPALRHRDFARLFAAQCVSVPGTYAAHVGLAVYAWEATGSATWVAAVTFGCRPSSRAPTPVCWPNTWSGCGCSC